MKAPSKKFSEDPNDPVTRIFLSRNKARMSHNPADYLKTLSLCETLPEPLRELPKVKHVMASCFEDLAFLLPQEAKKYFSDALSIRLKEISRDNDQYHAHRAYLDIAAHYLKLVEFYEDDQYYAEAEEYLSNSRIIKNHPNTIHIQAQIHIDRGEIDKAALCIQEGIKNLLLQNRWTKKELEEIGRLYIKLSRCYEISENYVLALEIWEKNILHDYKDIVQDRGWQSYGELLYANQQYERALTNFKMLHKRTTIPAIKEQSSILKAHCLEKLCFNNPKKIPSAQKAYQQHLDNYPYDWVAKNSYAYFLGVHDNPKACIDYLQRVIKEDNFQNSPKRCKARAYHILGLAYHDDNQREKAIEFFKKSKEADPTFASADSSLGHRRLEKRGKNTTFYGEKFEHYRDARIKDPKRFENLHGNNGTNFNGNSEEKHFSPLNVTTPSRYQQLSQNSSSSNVTAHHASNSVSKKSESVQPPKRSTQPGFFSKGKTDSNRTNQLENNKTPDGNLFSILIDSHNDQEDKSESDSFSDESSEKMHKPKNKQRKKPNNNMQPQKKNKIEKQPPAFSNGYYNKMKNCCSWWTRPKIVLPVVGAATIILATILRQG